MQLVVIVGNSMELIQMGKQDIVFAGGSEEIHWAMTAMFDAMTASSKYNDTPEKHLEHTRKLEMVLLLLVELVF